MIAISQGAAFLAGAVLLAVVVGGAAMLFVGLRARGEAAAARAEAERLAALLRGAPALAMTVLADGRIEMPRRLADWLGLAEPARFLPELTADDAGADRRRPQDADRRRRGGAAGGQGVRARGAADRVGTDADDAGLARAGQQDATVIWFFDASDREAEIARLTAETARLGQAFDAAGGADRGGAAADVVSRPRSRAEDGQLRLCHRGRGTRRRRRHRARAGVD